MKRCIYFVSVLLVSMGLLIGSIARAQALRDPTLAPAAPGSGPDGATVSSSSPLGDAGVAVVVRSGKSFLVSGTRLYGVGQKLGNYRIERISETEVWLRNGAELQKIQHFVGIQRSAAAAANECLAASNKPNKSSKPSSSPSPKVASCAGAQP